MKIYIFSIFPKMVEDFLSYGLISKALETQIENTESTTQKKLKDSEADKQLEAKKQKGAEQQLTDKRQTGLDISVVDIRDGSKDKHRSVDDAPFGGGAGMVLSPEPIFNVVEATDPPRPLYLLSPTGRKIDQKLFEELAFTAGFSLLCGRYEGVDARVSEELVDGELSLGDFILQGGEVAAMAILEGVSRLLEGTLGNELSTQDESFSSPSPSFPSMGFLEYPQYTRPENFRGQQVPAVLRSGNHELIQKWRRAKSIQKTMEVRPDIIEARGGLTDDEQALLEELLSGKLDL